MVCILDIVPLDFLTVVELSTYIYKTPRVFKSIVIIYSSYFVMRAWLLLLLFCCFQVFVLPLFSTPFDSTYRVTNSVDNKLHAGDSIVSLLVLENPTDDSKTLVFVKRDNNSQKLRLKLSKGKRNRSVVNNDDLATLNDVPDSTTAARKLLLKKNRRSRMQSIQQRNCSASSFSKQSNYRKMNLRSQKKGRSNSSKVNRYLKLKHKHWPQSKSKWSTFLNNGTNPRKLFLRKYRQEQLVSNLTLPTTKLSLRKKTAKRMQGMQVHKKLLLRQKTVQRHLEVHSQPWSLSSLSTLSLPNKCPISFSKGTKLLVKNKKQRRDAIRPANKLLLRQHRGKHANEAATAKLRPKLLLKSKKKMNQLKKSTRKLKFRKSNSRGGQIVPPQNLPSSLGDDSQSIQYIQSQPIPQSPRDNSSTSDAPGGNISAVIFAAVAILWGTLLHPMLQSPTLTVNDDLSLPYGSDSERKKKAAGTPHNSTASPFVQEDDGMAALSIAQREHAQYSIDDEPQLWQTVCSPFKSAFSFGQICTPTPAESAPPNTKASTASRMVTRAMSAALAASNHVDGLSPARKLF